MKSLELKRQNMIFLMRNSLSEILEICEVTEEELEKKIGLDSDWIDEIKKGLNQMKVCEYLAICAILEEKIKEDNELLQNMLIVLSENIICEENLEDVLDNPFKDMNLENLFLNVWFDTFNEENKLKNDSYDKKIENMVNEYKIFINFDVLEHEKAEEFFDNISRYLSEEEKKIIIPLKVIQLIQENSKDHDENIKVNAKRALEILKKLQKNNLLDIRGEVTDDSINSVLQSVFAKHRIRHRLILLTQNKALAEDILALNDSKTIDGYIIGSFYLDDEGVLKNFIEEQEEFLEDDYSFEEEYMNSVDDENTELDVLGWETID